MGLATLIGKQGTPKERRDTKGRGGRELVRAAGDLFPISAIGADGTMVLEDGSLVHILACSPPNQQSMDADALVGAFRGFRALAARLERGQVLQMQVEGDLLETGEHMDFYRRHVQAAYGFDPMAVIERDAPGLPEEQRARWALCRMLLESVRRSAPEGFSMRRRCYLIVRYQPRFDVDASLADALPAWIPGSRARGKGHSEELRQGRARTLREHRRITRRAANRVQGFVRHLARDGTHSRVLNGSEVLRYLISRANPTSSTWGRLESEASWDGVLSRFDSPVECEEADEVARRVREQIARSPMDFRRDVHYGEVEQDLVRTGYLGGIPSSTRMYWLEELLHQPLPFTLSVFWHELARSDVQDQMNRAWHQAQRENERRIGKGRRDAQAERQEREQEAMVDKMADDPQAGLVEVSTYLVLRAPGPRPNAQELEEAAYQAGQMVHRATAGGTLMPGTREQLPLWRSTLPLGMDVAHKTLRFEMEHAADTTALIGSSCGSPQGLPMLVSPTGEIEYINPFDRAHRNHSMVISGISGTGKTNLGNRLVAHFAALGVQWYVFDRAGHYDVLGELIPGARKLALGSEDSPYVINHWDTTDPWNVPKTKVQFLVELHRVMLEIDLTRMQEALLANCIRATYAHCASQEIAPRESELVKIMAAYAEQERGRAGGEASARTAESLAAELGEFVGEGIYAHLWDRETNIPHDAPLLIFDSSGAGQRMLIPLMFAAMAWVRDRVQRTATQPRQRGASSTLQGCSGVLLDEGWSWAQVPELAGHIQDWARQSRHLRTCFVVMSQDAKDFEGIAEAVLRNAVIKLYLEQDQAMLAYLKETTSVSAEIVDTLKDLRTVKGEYSEGLLLNGTRGTGRVRVMLGAHEYWAFTSEPNYDRPRRDEALAEHDGNVWAALATLADREGIPQADAGMTA